MVEPSAEAFSELKQFALDPDSVKRLSLPYCQQHRIVILGRIDEDEERPVLVGMLRPADAPLAAEIAAALGREIVPVQLNAYEIRRAIAEGFGLPEPEADRYRLELAPVREVSFAPESPVAEMLNEILGRAVGASASDVHIETYVDDVDVRFRIDGLLHQVGTPLSRDNVSTVIARLKVLAGLDIAERRVAQDGRIRAIYKGDGTERPIDFRLSVVPGPFGEDAVLRILDSSLPVQGLGELGLSADMLAAIERIVGSPEGLLLAVGPTGSGKTTTLYAALDRVRVPERKILTVEDPIEYHFEKTCQKQVSTHMGFADYARAFMRQNPDVILIGEIRDEATASAALRAAQTGHLVLSTLHTADAVRVVTRLHTLGIDLNLIAGTLLASLSQRLVRRLCPACRHQAPPHAHEAVRLGLREGDGSFFRASGCGLCRGTGYRGRAGIFELFVPDEEMADMIAAGEPIHVVRRRAIEAGMKTLLDDALDKARAGITSLREIERTVPYRMLAPRR